MASKTLDAHIEMTQGIAGGKPRIAGRRITVQNVVMWHERMGKSIDEISEEHDLDIADIHAALTYYFDHREEIDKTMRESDDLVASLRQSMPSKLYQKLYGQTVGSCRG